MSPHSCHAMLRNGSVVSPKHKSCHLSRLPFPFCFCHTFPPRPCPYFFVSLNSVRHIDFHFFCLMFLAFSTRIEPGPQWATCTLEECLYCYTTQGPLTDWYLSSCHGITKYHLAILRVYHHNIILHCAYLHKSRSLWGSPGSGPLAHQIRPKTV